jgi:16S rRNA processing protein RimM
MGRVGAPYGVRGWFRVQSFTEAPDGLADYPHWWIGHDPSYKECRLLDCRMHAGALVAYLEGVDDRTAVQAMQGSDIAIPRDQLPEAEEGEIYWADLMGLEVVNLAGESLGKIADMVETGANDVMVVQGPEKRTLIPYVEPVVARVDLAQGRVTVDWGLDY